MHLILICLQNSWKSFLNSGSLILFWIGANSRHFSETLISDFERTLSIKLKTVPEQQYPVSLSHWNIFGVVCWLISQASWSSSKIPNTSLSCRENKAELFLFNYHWLRGIQRAGQAHTNTKQRYLSFRRAHWCITQQHRSNALQINAFLTSTFLIASHSRNFQRF